MLNKLILSILIFLNINCFSQNPNWLNYTSGGRLEKIAGVNDDILIVGIGTGLLKLNTTTWAKTFYNKANSGIRSNMNSCVIGDAEGNIWIGSSNYYGSVYSGGLSHFDGNSWENFTTDNSGLPSDDVHALGIDHEGRLWVGASGEGVAVFDGTSWIYYSPSNSIVPAVISDIEFSEDGSVWLGSSYNGIYKFDGTDWLSFTESNSGLPSDEVADIEIDNAGNIWIGTIGQNCGLSIFDTDGNWFTYTKSNSGISSNSILSVHCTDNAVWIGTSGGGASCLRGSDWETFTPLNSGLTASYVNSIYVDNSGVVWAATSAYGLFSYDGTDWYSHLNTIGKLQGASAYDISIGNDGKKWIATNSGLAINDGFNWDYINVHNSNLASIALITLASDASGNCWLGCADHGLFYYNGSEVIDFSSPNPILTGIAFMILETHDAELWVGTYGDGVYVYNGLDWRNYNTSNSGLSSAYISSIAFDNVGDVWIGGGAGLSVLHNDNTWEHWNCHNSDLPCTDVNAIEFDADGNVWFGTDDGLFMFDGTNFTIYNKANSDIPDDYIMSLKMDDTGKLWVGTLIGLASYEAGVWEVYNAGNSGITGGCRIYAIAMDDNGDKWIGTSYNGVAVYNENGVDYINEGINGLMGQLSINNYPNPCNESTTIRYTITDKSNVQIKLLDQNGKLISQFSEGMVDKGEYELLIDTKNYLPGIYYYQITTNEGQVTNKMIISK